MKPKVNRELLVLGHFCYSRSLSPANCGKSALQKKKRKEKKKKEKALSYACDALLLIRDDMALNHNNE